ncbi:hypothetical protein CEUSTIGMA_g11835.t1 [Chlamydomonas eustigma]|uniref:EGF-like domain-containing protein n=1 Tax=Chlamydomonas eustigma TaxID=1157962 RepID=A0A250XMV7_9CHLO|nr:hypothetical protein CEUSTIGMA_g11835.t1 [Chlamydomonas eustigma]|eukprot:GAX84414.1 hypothetical protein CEUSTIGMA_g11835.t1 [Chlamydomonas eustigma]
MKSRTRYATLLYTLFLIAENCVSLPLNTSAYLSQIVEDIHAARPLRNSYQIPCSPVFQLLTLALFYNSTNGPNWYRKDGWNSTVWTVPNIISYVSKTCTQKLGTSVISLPAWCCWYGVYCCLSQNSCPNIVMNNGTYVEQLICGNCTVGNITGLDLADNNLIGNISWSNVTQEISYPLYHQFLPAIACDMKFLFLQNNQLEETIPQALSDFTALKAVNLGYNQIRGQLPPLQNLDYLQVLAVANNRISGALPTGICAGNNSITNLILGNNLLTGTFDTTGCRLLISVQSQNNKIKGTLPNLTGYGALHILQMANNLITGSIPPGFGKGKFITSLNLASNRLNGTIPADFSLNLQYLNQLSLTNNYFEGTIPTTFFSYLGSLSAAYFDNNFLSGSIPDSIR